MKQLKKVKLPIMKHSDILYTAGSSTMPRTKEIYRSSSLVQQKRKLEAGKGCNGS